MSTISNPVNLTIDGLPVTVERGTTIMQAAESLGIFIPHFCFHKDLSWSGTCRMCFVEVKKSPKLVTSCCIPAAEGMEVLTNSPAAREGRRSVLEFLLLHHPIDCPICDQAGECYLQDYYMEYGLYDSKIGLADKLHKSKVLRLSDMIVLDRERCVLCLRCVRFCAEVSGSNALDVKERGEHTEIATRDGGPLCDPYSGNLADICPVGALTSARFRFKCRVWFLESAESICAFCSTGCDIRIDHCDGVIHRFVPRRNLEVNSSWLCDEGRNSHYELGNIERRFQTPLLRSGDEVQSAGWDDALDEVVAILKSARHDEIAGLASARASNEDLFLFRRLIRDVCKSPHLDFRVDDRHKLTKEKDDNLLRRRDIYPNSTGARDMGALPGADGLDTDEILENAAAGKIKVLFILDDDPAARDAVFIESLRNVDVILLTPWADNATLSASRFALPIAAFTERSGTFTNYARRVQRFHKSIDPPGDARPAWRVLADISNRMGSPVGANTAEEIFDKLIAREIDDYRGLVFDALGPGGIRIERR